MHMYVFMDECVILSCTQKEMSLGDLGLEMTHKPGHTHTHTDAQTRAALCVSLIFLALINSLMFNSLFPSHCVLCFVCMLDDQHVMLKRQKCPQGLQPLKINSACSYITSRSNQFG